MNTNLSIYTLISKFVLSLKMFIVPKSLYSIDESSSSYFLKEKFIWNWGNTAKMWTTDALEITYYCKSILGINTNTRCSVRLENLRKVIKSVSGSFVVWLKNGIFARICLKASCSLYVFIVKVFENQPQFLRFSKLFSRGWMNRSAFV